MLFVVSLIEIHHGKWLAFVVLMLLLLFFFWLFTVICHFMDVLSIKQKTLEHRDVIQSNFGWMDVSMTGRMAPDPSSSENVLQDNLTIVTMACCANLNVHLLLQHADFEKFVRMLCWLFCVKVYHT